MFFICLQVYICVCFIISFFLYSTLYFLSYKPRVWIKCDHDDSDLSKKNDEWVHWQWQFTMTEGSPLLSDLLFKITGTLQIKSKSDNCLMLDYVDVD